MKTRSTLLALPLLALAGCFAKNNASVEIAAICAAPDDAAVCAFSETCGAQTLGFVTLDLAGGASAFLTLPLQVNNQLPNNANLDTFRLNTNDAWVHEFTITFEAGGEVTGPVDGSAFVPAAGSAVIAISIPFLAAGYDIGHLRLRGVYGDTRQWETGEFDVAILVCSGCLAAAVPACTGGFAIACPGGSLQSPQSYACPAATGP